MTASLTTWKRAIEAVEEAKRRGIPVKSFRIEGKAFEVVLGEPETGDDYDLRSMKL